MFLLYFLYFQVNKKLVQSVAPSDLTVLGSFLIKVLFRIAPVQAVL